MGYQLNRQKIGEAVYFSSVTDSKFKHNRISVNILLPLCRDTVSDQAVVPFVLRKGYKDYPDFTKLNERLCDLYGAYLDADVTKLGGYQIVEVTIQGIDSRFTIDNENLVKECADLLCGVLLKQNLPDGLLSAKDVELEQQYIIDTIEAEINDKRTYAIGKALSIMCEGEAIAVRKLGTKEQAKQITPQSATEAYHRAIQSGLIEIIFTGSGNPTDAQEIFTRAFQSIDRAPAATTPLSLKNKAEQVKEKSEEMDVSQSKLVMGFRTGEICDAQELSAMRMMVGLFGGTPFSKLFVNVREKLSLCYYCAARFDRLTGLLLVDSGVELENSEKAKEEILRQLEAVKNGEFEEAEVTATRLTIQNALNATTDSLSAIEDWYLTQILSGTQVSPQEEALALEKITRQDIINAANKVTLDTVYLLKGKAAQAE